MRQSMYKMRLTIMSLRIFLTGTDTGVGKTFFGSWLVRRWKQQGHLALGLKPIAAGDRDDAVCYHQAIDASLSLDTINPLCFRLPASSLVAAENEGRSIDLKGLNAEVQQSVLPFSHA